VRSPRLKQLIAYWFDRRSEAAVTKRSAIDPLDFPALLPRIFLYDYDPVARRFVLRLAGEEIRNLLPNSTPGTPIEQIMPAAELDNVLARYGRVCEEPAIMHAAGRVFLKLGGSGVGERVVLPLAGEDGKVRQMIGATIYDIDRALPDAGILDHGEVAVSFLPLT
jgi:hypothetical protein